MIKWTVKYKGKMYAVFIYNKGLKLQEESDRARDDNLQDILEKKICIFDPRWTMLKDVNIYGLKDEYKADLFLTQLFTPYLKSNYTIDSQGLDWSKI